MMTTKIITNDFQIRGIITIPNVKPSTVESTFVIEVFSGFFEGQTTKVH